jgi:hypothetical protein
MTPQADVHDSTDELGRAQLGDVHWRLHGEVMAGLDFFTLVQSALGETSELRVTLSHLLVMRSTGLLLFPGGQGGK